VLKLGGFMTKAAGFILIIAIASSQIFAPFANAKSATKNADMIIYNGAIFTATEKNNDKTAIVINNGKIAYIGNDKTALLWAVKKTKKINAKGASIMPGIIDAHMHPQSGGLRMMMCNLNYEPLTMAQMNLKIQKCLDKEANAKPDDWLVVINWFEQEMLPRGFVPTFQDLAPIKTKRPIYIKNSFGHAALINQRGMEIIDLANQKERAGGIIVRDKNGIPTGRLEEAAKDIVADILPIPDEAKNLAAAKKAQLIMNAQGITSILDAYTDLETMGAYLTLQKSGQLKVRPHFAVLIDPDKEPNNDKSIAEVVRQRALFDQGVAQVSPNLLVHTAKMFLDGTVALPSMTGNMIEPYFENKGTQHEPIWKQGDNHGPKPYINQENLNDLVLKLADLGIDSHLHADGDGAVRLGLSAASALKIARPNSQARTAIAHAESVHKDDFGKFSQSGALPVLSFQWQKPAADTWEGTKDILGKARHDIFEPSGYLHEKGAKIVFGSDWPVDALNEWLALEVAITRRADLADRKKYPMRLGTDKGLSLETALRAMTINAAYSIHAEKYTGSLEIGKFGDVIVLDRNLFKTKPDDISKTLVKYTIVGGKVVYKK
jgi:predicted amidohydrolase YtcJ